METLVLLSYPQNMEYEIDLIKSFFKSGLQYFHLRKPQLNKQKTKEFLENIPENFYSRIVLHTHYDLVKQFGLKGIHITHQTKGKGYEKEFRDYHTSISAHSLNELKNLHYTYDYAFLSPVFDSISKKQYTSTFRPDQVKDFLSSGRTNVPVIALGGIDLYNLQRVADLGFDGFAILGSIWEKFRISSGFDQCLNHFLKMAEFVNKTK